MSSSGGPSSIFMFAKIKHLVLNSIYSSSERAELKGPLFLEPYCLL